MSLRIQVWRVQKLKSQRIDLIRYLIRPVEMEKKQALTRRRSSRKTWPLQSDVVEMT